MPEVRDDGAFHLAIVESMPVDSLKERVRLYSLGPTRDIPKPLRRIDGTESPNQVMRFRGHAVRIPNPPFYNPVKESIASVRTDLVAALHFVDLHGVLVPERRLPHQEFIYQDTECPPIDSGAVP